MTTETEGENNRGFVVIHANVHHGYLYLHDVKKKNVDEMS